MLLRCFLSWYEDMYSTYISVYICMYLFLHTLAYVRHVCYSCFLDCDILNINLFFNLQDMITFMYVDRFQMWCFNASPDIVELFVPWRWHEASTV